MGSSPARFNRFTELATITFASFHASLHLQQSALHTSPEQVALPFRRDLVDSLEEYGLQAGNWELALRIASCGELLGTAFSASLNLFSHSTRLLDGACGISSEEETSCQVRIFDSFRNTPPGRS